MCSNVFQILELIDSPIDPQMSCFCAVIVDGMYSDEELFLTQNSFPEEILQHNFSIDSI